MKNDKNMSIEDQIFLEPKIQESLKHLKERDISRCRYYWETIPLDDYDLFYKDEKRFSEAVRALNFYPTDFTFEIGGDAFRPDLIITSKRLKTAYDKLPKTKSWKDLFNEVNEKYGITSSSMFHVKNLNQKMTDEEYESRMSFYKICHELEVSVFKEDESDD